jgi:F-type H+-transporting ATPase subunit b
MQVYPNATILFQFLQILALVILLNFLLFKPILKALKKRQETVRSLGDQAEGRRREAEGMGKAYDESMKGRKTPILEERDGLLKQTHAASMKVIEEARRDLTEELAKVKDGVRREAEKALQALKVESDALAGEIVKKIMKRGA